MRNNSRSSENKKFTRVSELPYYQEIVTHPIVCREHNCLTTPVSSLKGNIVHICFGKEASTWQDLEEFDAENPHDAHYYILRNTSRLMMHDSLTRRSMEKYGRFSGYAPEHILNMSFQPDDWADFITEYKEFLRNKELDSPDDTR